MIYAETFLPRKRPFVTAAGANNHRQHCLRINPDNFKAHGNLGVIFTEQGNAASTEARFRSALRINPEDALAQECLNELLKAKVVRQNRNQK